jgi:hypothetical protein
VSLKAAVGGELAACLPSDGINLLNCPKVRYTDCFFRQP